jgi:hypothetical protein
MVGVAAGVALALGGGIAAEAADPAGGYWPVLGRGKITVLRSGTPPVRYESNLRLDLDGVPGDGSGTGRILVYDDTGGVLLHQVPFAWTEGRGRTFRLDPSGPELGEFLVQRYAIATGASSTLTLDEVTMKGTVRRAGETVSLAAKVKGRISIEGGEPLNLRAALKAR